MSFTRKVTRKMEKQKQKDIKVTYNKKPKDVCPICKKHSVFMKNSEGHIFCVRCDNLVK